MKEQSKLFKTMGTRLGLKEVRRTHRGYIAKRYMPKVEAFELSEFSKQLVNMTPVAPRAIPVRDMKGEVSYINL